jgi:serine/threonine protein kinase
LPSDIVMDSDNPLLSPLCTHPVPEGDVKIFDFGLAREFDPVKQDVDGCYNLTGDTGSMRYMAPEVALNKP